MSLKIYSTNKNEAGKARAFALFQIIKQKVGEKDRGKQRERE